MSDQVTAVKGDQVTGIKRAVKRFLPLAVAGRIAFERAKGVRRLLGRRAGGMGATHRGFELEESLDYIDAVFEDYLTYGGIDRAEIEGMHVLELGPGDNFGVALRFLAAGAARVVSVDRFIPYRDPEYQLRVYDGLLERLDGTERARISSVTSDGRISFDGVELEILEETPIEDAPGILGAESFDLIVSRAVLEHVYDLDGAFASMTELLKPSGRMVHKVDLRDHGLFEAGGHNPLTLLTISDRVYRWMGERPAGLPNRRRLDWYRRAVDEHGYNGRFLITHLAGIEPEVEPHAPLGDGLPDRSPLGVVEEIRPRLQPQFRGASDEELAITGFMLVADRAQP